MRLNLQELTFLPRLSSRGGNSLTQVRALVLNRVFELRAKALLSGHKYNPGINAGAKKCLPYFQFTRPRVFVHKFQLLLCLPFVFATSLLQAQNSVAELWTGFEFEKRLHKRVDWEAGTEIRLTSWEKTFKSWLIESGFTFEANKYLRFAPGYRLTYRESGISHRAGYYCSTEI